jgi:hypothetical protein
VNEEYLNARAKPQPEYPIKGLNNASSSSSHQAQNGPNKFWRRELMDRQDSQPPKAIQKAYAHPSWIPLARLGVETTLRSTSHPDKWGQVIMDYDCKYVVALSWSHFMAVLADDMNSDKTFVVEDSGELKLKEFKTEKRGTRVFGTFFGGSEAEVSRAAGAQHRCQQRKVSAKIRHTAVQPPRMTKEDDRATASRVARIPVPTSSGQLAGSCQRRDRCINPGSSGRGRYQRLRNGGRYGKLGKARQAGRWTDFCDSYR